MSVVVDRLSFFSVVMLMMLLTMMMVYSILYCIVVAGLATWASDRLGVPGAIRRLISHQLVMHGISPTWQARRNDRVLSPSFLDTQLAGLPIRFMEKVGSGEENSCTLQGRGLRPPSHGQEAC